MASGGHSIACAYSTSGVAASCAVNPFKLYEKSCKLFVAIARHGQVKERIITGMQFTKKNYLKYTYKPRGRQMSGTSSWCDSNEYNIQMNFTIFCEKFFLYWNCLSTNIRDYVGSCKTDDSYLVLISRYLKASGRPRLYHEVFKYFRKFFFSNNNV